MYSLRRGGRWGLGGGLVIGALGGYDSRCRASGCRSPEDDILPGSREQGKQGLFVLVGLDFQPGILGQDEAPAIPKDDGGGSRVGGDDIAGIYGPRGDARYGDGGAI
jgi:hypothetical protein